MRNVLSNGSLSAVVVSVLCLAACAEDTTPSQDTTNASDAGGNTTTTETKSDAATNATLTGNNVGDTSSAGDGNDAGPSNLDAGESLDAGNDLVDAQSDQDAALADAGSGDAGGSTDAGETITTSDITTSEDTTTVPQFDCAALDVVNQGSVVWELPPAGDLPVFDGGGPIPDGTYVLTDRWLYGDGCGCTAALTVVVANDGTTFEAVSSVDGEPETQFAGSITYGLETMTLNYYCPTEAFNALSYNITETGFEWYDSIKGRVEVFVKQ